MVFLATQMTVPFHFTYAQNITGFTPLIDCRVVFFGFAWNTIERM